MMPPRLLSGVALLVLWSASMLVADTNAQPEGTHSGILANPLQVQSLDRLSATRDRPLFSPSRRPVPPPPPPVERVPEAAPPPPPPNVTVLGIVVDGEGARAMVRSGMKMKVERVQIGDDIGGWKVSEIEGRRLALVLDGRSAIFTLFSDERGNHSPDGAGDKLKNVPQRNQAQDVAPQTAESQPAASRKRRKSRE
jgi:general secretion pathway protein N